MNRIATGLMTCLFAVACSSAPVGLGPDAEVIEPPDAAVPDAAPPDASPPTLGPSLIFDDLHIAGFLEDAHAFSLLGGALNPQLENMISSGMLLLGVELRDIVDRTGGSDEEITVGMYYLNDSDEDPANNFDADDPEVFTLTPGQIVDGQPTLLFTDASITSSNLYAEGIGLLELAEGFPLPLSNLRLSGRLSPGEDWVRELESGRLRGVIGASLLSLTPNLAEGMCEGANLLDVFATGCGFFPLQPDSDVDGDGLETFFDTDGDGAIDRCVDGDGTEILGTECPRDPAIVDGYELIMVAHGVRAIILE